jgi:uncharacterized protein with von Willebrand factor type A (vWA) domain
MKKTMSKIFYTNVEGFNHLTKEINDIVAAEAVKFQPMKSKSTLNKQNILRIHKKVKGMIRVGWKVKPDTIVTTVDMIGKDGVVTSTENVTYRQLKKLVKTL